MDVESMLTGWNGVVTGAISGVVHAAKVFFDGSDHSSKLDRLLPILPLLLGGLAGIVGIVEFDAGIDITLAKKITAGLLLGTVSMTAFKVGKTTVLGKGLNATPDKSPADKEA